MALFPKVVEVSRDTQSGHVYVLVDFYPTLRDKRNGTNRAIREEFIMQLARQRAFVNDDGTTTLQDVDVLAEMRANVQRFVAVHDAKGTRGDLTEAGRIGRPRLRDLRDDDGILADLRGEVEA